MSASRCNGAASRSTKTASGKLLPDAPPFSFYPRQARLLPIAIFFSSVKRKLLPGLRSSQIVGIETVPAGTFCNAASLPKPTASSISSEPI